MSSKNLSLLIFVFVYSTLVRAKSELRCGWYENPSPGHSWLKDKDARWMVLEQGVFAAQGLVPDFKKAGAKTFVNAGAGFGYGCVCLKVKVDSKNKRITQIDSVKIKKLNDCRSDENLTEPKY